MTKDQWKTVISYRTANKRSIWQASNITPIKAITIVVLSLL